MSKRFVEYALCAIVAGGVLLGCQSKGASKGAPIEWVSFEDNGDKPGIGLRIRGIGEGLTGTMYLVDPSKPGDLSSGKAFPLLFIETNSSKIVFSVDLGEAKPRLMRLVLEEPKGSKMMATLSEDKTNTVPIRLVFEHASKIRR